MTVKVDAKKIDLFENTPIPKAVMTLALPTVISSLAIAAVFVFHWLIAKLESEFGREKYESK